MNKKISDILPKAEILAQLAEEASELAQAALKLRRSYLSSKTWSVTHWMPLPELPKEV